MSQLPIRSLRLRSYATTDLDRLTGASGEIFYDRELKTLKIYNGPNETASTVALGGGTVTPVDSLVNGLLTATLNSQGRLTVPGIITASTGQGLQLKASIGQTANLVSNNDKNSFYVNDTAAYAQTQGQTGPSRVWTFDTGGDLTLPQGGDVKNSSGQGIFSLVTNNYITSTSLASTLNSYVLKDTGATGNIFTSLIDSLDSSAITVTPTAIFSSDVVVENELTINTGIIKNAEATWQLNGTALELPEYGAVQSRSAVTIQAYDVDQSGGAINGSGSGFYAEVFAMVYGYDDVIIRANNNGSTKDWDFQADGRLVFPVAAVPARSFGAAGDRRGMLAIDDSYIYYCTANYVNNSTNIWKRTAHGAGTW